MKSKVIVFCVLLFCLEVVSIPLEESIQQKPYQPSNWRGNPNTAEHSHGTDIAGTQNINSMHGKVYNVNQIRQQLNNYGFDNHPPSLQSLPMKESLVNFANANESRSISSPSREDPYPFQMDNPPVENEQRGKQNWPSQNQFINSPSSTSAGQEIPSRITQESFHGRGQHMPTHTQPANHQQYQADRTPSIGKDSHYHQTAEIPESERHIPRSGPVSEPLNRPVRNVNHNVAPGAAINTNLGKSGNHGYEENSPTYSERAKPTHYETFNGPPASITNNPKSIKKTNNYLKRLGPLNIYNGHALPLHRELNNDNTGYIPNYVQGLRSSNQFSNNQVPYNHIPNYQVLSSQKPNNQIPNNRVLNNQGINNQVPNNQVPNNQVPNNQVPNNQVLNNQIPSDQVPYNQVNNNQVPDAYKNPTGQSNTAALKISEPINNNRYTKTPVLNPRSNNEPSIHNAHMPIDETVVKKYVGSPASNFEHNNPTAMNTYNGVPAGQSDSVLHSGEGNPLTNPIPMDSYNVAPLTPVDTMKGENNTPTELHHVSNFGPSNSSPPEEVNLYEGFLQHVSSASDRKTEADSYMNSQLEKIFSSRTTRYVIIHPNGTVENIDRLDQIKDSNTDYILVKKKESSADDFNDDSPSLPSPSLGLSPAPFDGQSTDSLLNARYNNPGNDYKPSSRAQLQNNNKSYKPLPVLQPGNDNTASPVFQSPSSDGYNPPVQPHTGTDYIPPVGPLIPNYNNGYNPSPVPQSLTGNEYNPAPKFSTSNDYNPHLDPIFDNNNSMPPSKLNSHISPNSISTTTTAAPDDELVEKYSLPNTYKNPSSTPLLLSGKDQKLPIEPLNGNNDDHRHNPISVKDHKTTPLKLHTVISPGIITSTTPKPKEESIQDFVDSIFNPSKDDPLSVVPLFDPNADNSDCSPRRLPLDDNDYELYSSALDENCTMPLSSTTSPSTVYSTTSEDGLIETFIASVTKADDIPSSTPSVPSGTDKYPSSSSKLPSAIDYNTTPLPLTTDSSSSSIAVTTSSVEKTTTDQIITISPIELATDNVKDGVSTSLEDEVTPSYDKQNTTNNSTLSPEYANINDIMQRSVAKNDISELYDLIIRIINENNSNSTGDKSITKKDLDKTTDKSKSATYDSLTKTDVPAASDDSSAVTTNSTMQNSSTTGDNLLESKAHTSDLTITISIPNDSDGTITIHVEVPDSTENEDTSGDDTVVLNIDTKNCSSTHSASGTNDSTSATGCNKNQTTSDELEENKNKLFDLSSTAVVFNKTSDQALCDQLANNSAVNVIYVFQMQPLIQPIVERNKQTTYYENGTIVEEISETTWEDKDDPSHTSVKKKIITHPSNKH